MPYLLDTSVAIELRDDKPRAVAAVEAMAILPHLSVVSRVELEGGVYARADVVEQRRRRLDALLSAMTIIPFDDEMAATYGRIVAQAGFNRRKSLDRMIAATALVRRLTLITINGSDFAGIEDLQLEIWDV